MPLLTTTLRAIRFTGLRVVLLSVKHSLRRLLRRGAPEPHPSDCILIPGGLLRGEPDASGLTLYYEHAQLRIDFLGPGIVRLDWGPGAPIPPYAIARQEWPDQKLQISESYSGWRLTSAEIDLHLDRTGAATFHKVSGGQASEPGETWLSVNAPKRSLSDADYPGPAWLGRASLSLEATIFGLGEQSGPLNLCGGSFRLWNTDPGGSYRPGDQPIYAPLPVYYTLQLNSSYLTFYENSFPGEIELDF